MIQPFRSISSDEAEELSSPRSSGDGYGDRIATGGPDIGFPGEGRRNRKNARRDKLCFFESPEKTVGRLVSCCISCDSGSMPFPPPPVNTIGNTKSHCNSSLSEGATLWLTGAADWTNLGFKVREGAWIISHKPARAWSDQSKSTVT